MSTATFNTSLSIFLNTVWKGKWEEENVERGPMHPHLNPFLEGN